MWNILAAVILTAAFSRGQFIRLLPSEVRHVVGTVVDPDGKPIAQAGLGHTNDSRSLETDSEGRFELDTRAPALVISKAGYRSELVRTQPSIELRVTLQRLSAIRDFPVCSETAHYNGLGGSAQIQFPRIPGVKASHPATDIGYSARSYYVKTKQGCKEITHVAGPLWSFGLPSDLDVLRSVSYEETTSKARDQTLVDARGQLVNGSRWRYLGMFGESASYSDVDVATPKILDHVLDGACLKP